MIQIQTNFHTGGIKCKIAFTLLFVLAILLPSSVFALATPEPYVVKNGTTLTFYYDANKSNHEYTVYDLHNYSWSEFPQWAYTDYTIVKFDQSMQNYHPTSTAFWFWMGANITSIDFTNLNTDRVTDMTAMFFGNNVIETLDLSNFNTSNVTQMACIFQNCPKLKTIYVDSEKWDLSNLEDNSVLLFFNDPLLMGGAGTLWQPRDEYSTVEYARIDGGESAPGYLTSKTQTKPTVANIKIKTLPTQLKYVPNEPLNIDKQAQMTVTLNNGRSFEQELSYANITGYTNDIGVQTLNVEYYGKSTTFDVTVEDKVAPYYYLSWYDTYSFVYDKYQEGYTYLCYDNIIKNNGSKEDISFIIFEESFKNYHPTSCAYWFYDLINVRSFSGWENFNTDNATNMEYMFYGCRSITSLDLKYFNTSNVANMNYMFSDCPSLKSIHVSSNWTTSAVTSSENMFKNCTSLKGGSGTTYDETKTDYTYAKIDGGTSSPGYLSNPASEPYAVINGNTLKFYYNNSRPRQAYNFETYSGHYWEWNQNITTVEFDPSFANYTPTSGATLFSGLQNLTEIKGFEYFNTSEITDMSRMFYCCFNLTSLDLSNFDTRKVTNMDGMFSTCIKLKTIYVGSNFQVASNIPTDNMFLGDLHLIGGKGTIYDMNKISDFDGRYAHVDQGDNNPGFFSTKGQSLPAVTAISISTKPQVSFRKMEPFNYENGILSVTYSGRQPQTLDFSSAEVSSNFDSSIVGTYPITVKYGGKSVSYNVKVEDNNGLYSIKSSNNVLTIYYGKYKNGASFFPLPSSVSNRTITKVIIDESLQKYTNLTSCASWFFYFENLTEIEGLDYLNTANVTNMGQMFEQCSSLSKLYLNSFNTSKVTTMHYMFSGCSSLTNIYVGGDWSTSSVTNSNSMFYYCQSLKGSSGTTYDETKIDDTYARIDGGTSSPGYFSTITAISVSLSKNQYFVGEELDLSNSILSISYSDGSSSTTSLNKATITGYNSNEVSTQTITATYMNFTTTFTVTVNATEANPYTKPAFVDSYYQIGTAEELLWFMFNVNSGDVTANAVLTQDIVINQDCLNQITEMLNKTTKAAPSLVEWRPIGDSNNAFMGMFDGQGHTISGLYIKDETLDNVGLFGSVGANAVIKNVGVVDSYIAGNENVGAICGKSEGTVANCYSTSIVSGAKNVGGVVGVVEEEAVVCNSYNLGTVISEDGKSAGVCNTSSEKAVVENCYYLTETPIANDPQAKTAEQFKSGEVAELLSKEVEIKGITYTNEIANNTTELPGMEEIEQRNNPDNPSTPVAKIADVDSNIKVWSYNRTIFIESLPNTEYRIIDLNGRLITTSTTKSTREEIRVNQKGVLVVIINGKSYKVSL